MKLCWLTAQEDIGDIFCTCLFAIENDQDVADIHAHCGGVVEDCKVEEITTVTDKGGARYRPMLLPDLSEEVKKDGQ